ncbi:GTP-binding protein [Coemansia sp. BCRC 34301]|nr:GTP-binding protein [Coemansia sp. BCRC 34301]
MTNPAVRNAIVLGGVGVGKSSVIQRFLKQEYSSDYYPTVNSTQSKILRIGEKEYNLTIMDTTGQILDMTGTSSVGIVLVGTKCDLVDERQVTTKEAQKVADEFKCPYMETSAKDNKNIEELFVESIKVANKSRGGSIDAVEGGDTTDKSTCVIM